MPEYSWLIDDEHSGCLHSTGACTASQNTRQILDRVFSEVFPEYFRPRVSCTRIPASIKPTQDMRQPAEKSDNGLFEHGSRQIPLGS